MSVNNFSCESQLNYIMESLQQHKIWSMEFLDLSAKLPIGILHQHHRSFGLFSECLEFRHETTDVGLIEGQYCTVSYESSLNDTGVNRAYGFDWRDVGLAASINKLKLQNGICAPKICTESSIQSFVNFFLSKADLAATNVSCSKNYYNDLGIFGYVSIFILTLLVLIVGISSYLDFKWRKNYDSKESFLTSFSIYTNTSELLKIDKLNTKKSIECINGLRLIAAYWVISGHRIAKGLDYHLVSMSRPIKPNFVFGILLQAGYAVDTFMIISSILVTQSCLRAYERGSFQIFKFYFNRYMRYTPVMAVIILFVLSYIPYTMVDGPIKYLIDTEFKNCHNHWLSALLHLQTYFNLNDSCMGLWWYLHADFHLFLISPIIIYILWKFRYKSFWGLSIGALAIQSYAFYVRTFNLVHPDDVYRLSHYRLSQWLVGIMFGYTIYEIENSGQKVQLSKLTQYTIWTVLIFLLSIIKSTLGWSPLYEVSHGFVVSIIVGWAITSFHCFGSGGILNWFLSHPIWQPLSKLTLCIYCAHGVYIRMMLSNMKELAFYEIGWMCHMIAGDIFISTFFAYILYVFVEAPVGNLVGLLLRKEKMILTLVPEDETSALLLSEEP